MTAAPERHSVRGFRPEPLPRATLEALFAAAQRAPSWCNTQPWRVWVTSPPFTAELSAAMVAAAKSGLPQPELAFPLDYPPPYQEHRRACGHALYGAMGIAREDKSGRYDAWLRNYGFFDAPHLAVVACDRRLLPYALIDVGVWLGLFLDEAARRRRHLRDGVDRGLPEGPAGPPRDRAGAGDPVRNRPRPRGSGSSGQRLPYYETADRGERHVRLAIRATWQPPTNRVILPPRGAT